MTEYESRVDPIYGCTDTGAITVMVLCCSLSSSSGSCTVVQYQLFSNNSRRLLLIRKLYNYRSSIYLQRRRAEWMCCLLCQHRRYLRKSWPLSWWRVRRLSLYILRRSFYVQMPTYQQPFLAIVLNPATGLPQPQTFTETTATGAPIPSNSE